MPQPGSSAGAITRQVSLSENGGGSSSVVIQHNFGAAAVVYVLKRVASTWVDAVGTVDVFQDMAFTTVTVVNTTSVPMEFLITLTR